ncbi:MAG: SusE domain-containing protein [Bacteroidota bacterium]|nr:SusE domain-containing protein [Bacteroidota bacterium]
MKNIRQGLLATLTLLLIASCKKDIKPLDLNLTAVSSLLAPSDNSDIQLQPATGGNIVFQWSAAQTPDSGVVLYEVAFDKADGDFTKPVYKILADGSGIQTQATVSQKDLNKIASLAGIEASSSGKVKWAVLASKATNTKISTETRTLQIARPAGFATVPDSLFLFGTATEAGNDPTNAIPLKKTADGVFELYTSLTAGSYLLTDQRNASGTEYYIDVNNSNIIKLGNTPTEVTGATKAFRLSYDFNVATSEATEIQSIGLFQSANNAEIGQLTYIGNSTWQIDSLPVVFVQFSWGRDDRYKFIVHTPAGLEYFGSQNANNVPPAGQPASYFYLFPVTNDQWNNTYKFDPSADNHSVKVDVYFNANGPYTHKVTVL